MTAVTLSPAAARVVAALVEKALTTPQYYPMTVNALMLASNQKNSRAPVMNLGEGDVGAALNELEALGLCARDDRSGRALKWRHSFQHAFLLNPVTLAVLVTLLLRGAQTAAELRANAAALGGPADPAALDTALADLSDRAQPLVALLPRAPGQKEARYAHLLSGAPAPVETTARAAAPVQAPPGIEQRLRELEARVEELERAARPPPQE
jgi:uncharacterized protein YceH (UPF0502 family)